jgi:selenocysteine lyase/cysteine desulfurase
VTEYLQLWEDPSGWLDTASYGLPPRPAWEALQEALAEWRVGRVSWRKWDASIDVARGAFARLIGAAPQDVAVGSTVAAALAVVASSLPEGTTVLVDDVEFTSNVFPWQVHADRGVRVVAAPTDELVAAIRPGIDVVAVSAVQSAAGTILDLPSVIAACAEVGARIILDASQAAGWLPLDASQVDVLVAHSYKFLMCPRGATFCFLSPRMREGMRPLHASWYAAEDNTVSYYGTQMDLAADARSYDQSPAWFSFVAAAPTLELIERIGVQVIHDHDVALANRFRAGLGMPASNSAIVTARLPGAADTLAAAGIRASVRNDLLRVAFHVYSTEADVARALEALRR